MARDGSGNYTLPAGNPVVTGTGISSTTHNATNLDLAAALTQSLSKDGQTAPIANLQMAGYKFTGVGDASLRDQYASAGQIQDGGLTYLTSVSGTDTIAASSSPAITAYVAGQKFSFYAAATNTGAVTLNINALGAKAITKFGTTALVAGDIKQDAIIEVQYDGTRFQLLGNSGDAGFVHLAGTETIVGNKTFDGTAAFNGDTTFGAAVALGAAATATTPAAGDSDTSVATTAYVQGEVVKAGRILQTIIATDPGSSTSGTSYTNLNASTIFITPKSTASVLLIEVHFQGQIANLAATNTAATFGIHEGATLIGNAYVLTAPSASGGVGCQAPCFIRSPGLANASLSARGFTLKGLTNNAGAAAAGINMTWVIHEIKA